MGLSMELKPVRRVDRNEVHIVNSPNGHLLDTDCWCEPTASWRRNKHNILMFVVEHKDNDDHQHLHHDNILGVRSRNADAITNLLNSIYMFEYER